MDKLRKRHNALIREVGMGFKRDIIGFAEKLL